ncbi:Spo0B domain-containing protein [Lentibacillus sp. N15]|uniref:Spo0B domain-containing protein n=1 Tax=Lentibacillus songyuanensis TaxID=3136161 RepID=UPI0031BB5824
MKEKETMEALRLYRHDLMNDLQIVQGYASMGNMEKVQEKLAKWMDHFNEERKLMNLDAPTFALWLIQFNSNHQNVRLSYYIDVEPMNLHVIDHTLVQECQSVINMLEQLGDPLELYEGELQLSDTDSAIQVTLSLRGSFAEDDPSKYPTKWKIRKRNDGVSCSIYIPYQK